MSGLPLEISLGQSPETDLAVTRLCHVAYLRLLRAISFHLFTLCHSPFGHQALCMKSPRIPHPQTN